MDTIYKNAKGSEAAQSRRYSNAKTRDGPSKFRFRIFERFKYYLYLYIQSSLCGSICTPIKYSTKVINAGERNVMELKQRDWNQSSLVGGS